MSRFLKSLHLFSLSFGFLSAVALAFNTVIFLILYPQVTQFVELDPSWESYGIVAAINIILIAIFHLASVITLLAHLVTAKNTSHLKVLTISLGIISGLMILADIALLSDIGKEFIQGWQTRGEWIILFISYGLHSLSMVLILITLIRNIRAETKPAEKVIKDEVLFLSLHSTGIICGWLGLGGVIAGIMTNLSAWMMERIIPMLGGVILSPYLAILFIWLIRRYLVGVKPGMDEKQFHDLSRAGLLSLLFSIPIMIVYFGMQVSPIARESWPLLWLPLLLFFLLTFFSSLTLRYFKE